jgi:hypothetical protein
VLAALDPLIRRLPKRDTVYKTIVEAFLWRGARQALGADDRWRSLRRGTVILAFRPPLEPRAFARQLRRLRASGHHVMSLDDYVDHRAEHRIPPARSVVITVDGAVPPEADGPVTAFVDAAAAAAPRNGLALGLHGGAGDADAEEVARRRRELEARLGHPVEHLSHPVEADPRQTAEVAAELGFRSACSNEPGINGPATPVHALRRIPLSPGVGRIRLRIALRTGK